MKGFWGTFFIFLLWATAGIYYIHIKENENLSVDTTDQIPVEKKNIINSPSGNYKNNIDNIEKEVDVNQINSDTALIDPNDLKTDSISTTIDNIDMSALSKSPNSKTNNNSIYITENTTVDSQLLADEIKKSIAISDTIDIDKDEPTIEYKGETVVKKNTSVASQIFYPGYANTDLIVGKDLIAYATELKQLLEENPTKKVTIIGHTDNVGNAKDNFMIGLKKSRQIKWYLTTRRGIEKSRVTAISRGESTPIESNTSVWGRKKNNRIEIIVD